MANWLDYVWVQAIAGFRYVLTPPRVWNVLSGVIAIASLLFAAGQMYQAAQIQAQAAALDKRMMMTGLALQANEAAYEYVAAVTHTSAMLRRSLVAQSADGEVSKELIEAADLPEDARIAAIKLEGAISRAWIIEDHPLNACLLDLSRLTSSIVENPNIYAGDNPGTEQLAIDLEVFTEMIGYYLADRAYKTEWMPRLDKNNNEICPIFDGTRNFQLAVEEELSKASDE